MGMVHSRLLRWVAAAEATGRRLVRHVGHARLQDVFFSRGVVPRKKDPPVREVHVHVPCILDTGRRLSMKSNDLLYYYMYQVPVHVRSY